METVDIEPARAALITERVLEAFHQAREAASQPPHEGQFENIRALLESALAELEAVYPIPRYRSDGKETSISRQAIMVGLDGEIDRLADLKVGLGLHRTRGDALTVVPFRVFVSAAVVARSILVCPPLAERKEVRGDDESDPASTFHG